MMDTLFADVSQFNPIADDHYPYPFISVRSNDGTYRDTHFQHNIQWCKDKVAIHRLHGFLTYFVYEPNWEETIRTYMDNVGAPSPYMATMIDTESWGGRIHGDQSVEINGAREMLISRYYRGNRARVIGYGNAGDLTRLWSKRGDCNIVLANYTANLPFPNKIAHQFSSSYYVPPFGRCDINSADGYSPDQFARKLGLPMDQPKPTQTTHYDPSKPHPGALVSPNGQWAYFMLDDGTLQLRHNGAIVSNIRPTTH